MKFSPIWERYIREFLLSSVQDGIMYIEARINFLDRSVILCFLVDEGRNHSFHRFMFGADGEENIPHDQWLAAFDRAVTGVKNELEAQNRGDEFVGARASHCLTETRLFLPDCYRSYIARSGLSRQKNSNGISMTALS